MYNISSQIADQRFENLQIQKIVKTNALEILSISLEKGATFPEHTSPSDAQLIVLEGAVIFNINQEEYVLLKHQLFCFPKETPHWVKANENSKFLIIR